MSFSTTEILEDFVETAYRHTRWTGDHGFYQRHLKRLESVRVAVAWHRARNKKKIQAWMKAYYQRPEVRARQLARQRTPEALAYGRAYKQRMRAKKHADS